MKAYILAVIVIIVVTISVFAQTPTPTPTPPPTDDVVVIKTSLIQIDVTVTDKNGKIIKDLKPEDFEIFENNDKQKITNFSFIQTQSTQTQPNISLPTAPITPDKVKRTIAFVVDDLNLSFESTAFAHIALKKFVDFQMQEGDLVAIIRTSAGNGALQQFTSDKRLLYAAIEKVRWSPNSSRSIAPFVNLDQTQAEKLYDPSKSPPEQKEQAEAKQKEEAGKEREAEFAGGYRFAGGTLGAVSYLIQGMKKLPGRKSLLLMTEGFDTFDTNRSGFLVSDDTISSAFKLMVELANRSSVVVYTMDTRGLQTTQPVASDNINVSGQTPTGLFDKQNERKQKLINTQAVLMDIARQTGGKAILNNNNLSDGIQDMLDDQKGYYLLGYQPDSDSFDAKTSRFNKLTVKVNRPDLRVRYRSGFFSKTNEEIQSESEENLTREQKLIYAINSPFVKNDVNLSLNAIYADDPKIGSYIRPILFINAKDLKFSDETDGRHKASFEVVAMTFDVTGKIIDQTAKGYTISPTNEELKQLLQTGFTYHFILPIKKSGAYQMRIALRDVGSDKVGSASQFIEIPNLKKNKLTLSSIVFENQANSGDFLAASSQRQFAKGSTLRFGFEIYNSLLEKATQKPNLEMKIRVYRNGKTLFEGNPESVSLDNQTDFKRVKGLGVLKLGKLMETGEYVLQVIISDKLAAANRNIATQFISFEVVN